MIKFQQLLSPTPKVSQFKAIVVTFHIHLTVISQTFRTSNFQVQSFSLKSKFFKIKLLKEVTLYLNLKLCNQVSGVFVLLAVYRFLNHCTVIKTPSIPTSTFLFLPLIVFIEFSSMIVSPLFYHSLF